MSKHWHTKEKDLNIAAKIMKQYASPESPDSFGLFELVLNTKQKRINFRLSQWVVMLARHFKLLYGADQGEFVTRKIISNCLTNGQTLH